MQLNTYDIMEQLINQYYLFNLITTITDQLLLISLGEIKEI